MNQPQLGSFESIPLSAIRPSRTNPRKNFDETAMAELTRSVERMGVTQPILLRPAPRYFAIEDIGVWKVYEFSAAGDRKEPWIDLFEKKGLLSDVDAGREPAEKRAAELNADDPVYEIVSGERRYRAAKAAPGLTTVPAFIRILTDDEALDIQMIENLQRQDLHPVEEAEGFRVLLSHDATVEDVAKKSGKTVGHVQRIVKLLSLEVDAKRMFVDGHLTLDHALLLARLTTKDQERALRFLLNGTGDYSEGFHSEHP